MRRRMFGSVLLLATLTLSLIVGDVLVTAQDPPTTPPTQTPQTQTSQTQMTPTEQTDLSGTYAGTFNCDALGLTGDTTLTITGNQFTTADGKTGRIVASTTRGYTAVALQIGDTGPATAATTGAAATMAGGSAATPTTVSMRARKSGDRLTLTSVPGAAMQCSFTPARNVARGRRSRQRTPAATGTEVANPSAQPTTTPTQPMPDPSQTPSPTPSPMPTPSPAPEPSPSPMPSPTPSGSPTPEPTPSGTPSPTPSPSPSPSPRSRG